MNVLKNLFNVLKAKSPPQEIAHTVQATINPSLAFLERCNPYKDLPDDANTIKTLRKVNYIKVKLRYFLVPTSLPGDDYALCSALLRSLETRRDLTWLVLHETDIQTTIRTISRRGSPREPIPEEPFDLTTRAAALTAHWTTLSKQSQKPRPWELAASTEHHPPLLSEEVELDLEPAQIVEAEAAFKQWRTDRDLKASYFKGNPPQPTGYVQATRDEVPIDETWEVLPWVVLPGTTSPNDGSRRWIPIYTSYSLPFGWRSQVAPRREETQEEKDRWEEEYKKGRERADEQREFQKQLRKANSR